MTLHSPLPDPSAKWILGVDGGGTKTLTKIATISTSSNLQILGSGVAGPGNPCSVGFECACENILSSIQKAIAACNGLTPNSIDAGCLSIAGAGRPDDQQKIRERFLSTSLFRHLIVTEDVEPLRFAPRLVPSENGDSTVWDTCLTLIAGTGSIAKLNLDNGDSYRVGGWGYLLGDEGSGFSIGLAALKNICKQVDDGQPLAPIHIQILKRLNLEKPTELVSFVHSKPIPRPTIAALASEVLGMANTDPLCLKIAREAIDAWETLCRQLISRLSVTNPIYGLAIGGGIAVNQSWMVEELVNRLQSQGIAPTARSIIKDPVMGSLQIAREYLDSVSQRGRITY